MCNVAQTYALIEFRFLIPSVHSVSLGWLSFLAHKFTPFEEGSQRPNRKWSPFLFYNFYMLPVTIYLEISCSAEEESQPGNGRLPPHFQGVSNYSRVISLIRSFSLPNIPVQATMKMLKISQCLKNTINAKLKFKLKFCKQLAIKHNLVMSRKFKLMIDSRQGCKLIFNWRDDAWYAWWQASYFCRKFIQHLLF